MTRTIVPVTLLALVACLSAAASTPVVTVSYPANGSAVHGPVYYAASASSPSCAKGIASMRIYSAPFISAYTVNAAQFSTFISLTPGTYNTVVQSWDYCGGVGKTSITITYSYTGVRRLVARAAEAAEIGHLTTHAFRHTYRTWLNATGTPLQLNRN